MQLTSKLKSMLFIFNLPSQLFRIGPKPYKGDECIASFLNFVPKQGLITVKNNLARCKLFSAEFKL